MFWNRSASVDERLETVPIGMPRGNFDFSGPAPSEPAVTIVSPTRTTGRFGTRSSTRTSLDPPPRLDRADHLRVRDVGRGDGALAVGEQRHARLVREDAVDRADERAASVRAADRFDDDAAHANAVGRAGADDDALFDRALRVRDDRRVHLVEVGDGRRPLVVERLRAARRSPGSRLRRGSTGGEAPRSARAASCSRSLRRRARGTSRSCRRTGARSGRRRPRTAGGPSLPSPGRRRAPTSGTRR